MERVDEIIKSQADNSNTVNSKYKYINKNTVNSSNTVNGITVSKELTVSEKIEAILDEAGGRPEGTAHLLAEMLDDKNSLDYYLLLAKNNSEARLLEAAHLTKDAYARGIIRTKKATYFLGILRKWRFRVKFKKTFATFKKEV